MATVITGRHADVSESMKEYAGKRVDKLLEEFPRVDDIHVILDIQKFTHVAEVIAHARRQIRLEAKAHSETMYAAIDEVADKIEAQLRKVIGKRHDHKGGSKIRDVEPAAEA
jgi:putative sigma-54 modulation protein